MSSSLKVKLYLDTDEFYPWYFDTKEPRKFTEYILEVEPEFRDRLERINAEFMAIQKEIDSMVEGMPYLPCRNKGHT